MGECQSSIPFETSRSMLWSVLFFWGVKWLYHPFSCCIHSAKTIRNHLLFFMSGWVSGRFSICSTSLWGGYLAKKKHDVRGDSQSLTLRTHQRGARWVMCDQGITTKTKPTIIYNYDYRRLLKPRWDWMTGKQFLPKKNRKSTKNKVDLDPIEEVLIAGTRSCDGFRMVALCFLPTSSNMGKRSWKTSENMRKHGRHGHLLNQYWLQTHSGKKIHDVRWCGQSFLPCHRILDKSLSKDPWKLPFFAFNMYSI